MKKEFFGLLCGCTLLPAFLHAQTERPNIVIVLADDLGWYRKVRRQAHMEAIMVCLSQQTDRS